jgi:putative flippase GtrA
MNAMSIAAANQSFVRRLPQAKLSRSMAVSVTTTVLSLSILVVLTATRSLDATMANVVATVTGIGPSYVLNRRWVWRCVGRGSTRREILPFCTMSLSALALSTVAVHYAADWAIGNDLGRIERTTVVVASNIATFGSLWVAQFFILDRLLFGRRDASGDPRGLDVHSKPAGIAEETSRPLRQDTDHAASAVGLGRR